MKRREFLSALAASALCASWPGAAAQAQPGGQPPAAQPAGRPQDRPPASQGAAQPLPPSGAPKRLAVVFVRGGLDGLSAIAPVGEARYYALRPTIALAPPGHPEGALPLAGAFGLHPALEPLLDYWKAGQLAAIQAIGLADLVRAHPDAQRAVESGQPHERFPRDGWMGRLLPLLGPDAKALCLAPKPALICQGRVAATHSNPTGYPAASWRADRPELFTALDQLYRGQDPIGRAYRQSQVIFRNRLADVEREIRQSAAEAPSVHALPDLALKIGQYVEKNPATRLVFLGLGGVDSHTAQGAGKGRLAEVFYSLGRGLAALAKALGPQLGGWAIVVVSEFGRSLAENDFGGTDNGHGGLALVLGENVAGGRFHGDWPGLGGAGPLGGGNVLPVTTDYRELIGQVCQAHFALPREALSQVVPGYVPKGNLADLFKKA